jgi:hypothetical protein
MTAMTHGRTELTIELRTPHAFATVFADRTTFDGGQFIAWQDGAAIASYPVDAVAGLRFGGSAPIADVSRNADADAVSDVGTHQIAPTAVPSTDIEAATTSPAGAGWTPGEDALLRTLSEQDAGLTMMILKTQRPMDEVIARLAELGIAATRR